MRPGREPLQPDDRLRGVRRRSDDVGAADGVLERGGGRRAELGGELLRLRRVAARDPDLAPVAHARECVCVRARLRAGAEDRRARDASSRASSRAASAAAPAVRASVTYVPSISAIGVPVSGSKSMIAAWCVGRSVLPGKSVTSLQPRPAEGEVGGHRAEQARVVRQGRDPRRHRDRAGRELRVRARERASSSSRSRSSSTSERVRTSIG